MCFQHVAVKNNTGPKSWGNAKSTDLMHWKQYPHAINPYPDVLGKDGVHAIWSGSAVVDVLNGLGKQAGDVKTLSPSSQPQIRRASSKAVPTAPTEAERGPRSMAASP